VAASVGSPRRHEEAEALFFFFVFVFFSTFILII
jgi:hypothetical protein